MHKWLPHAPATAEDTSVLLWAVYHCRIERGEDTLWVFSSAFLPPNKTQIPAHCWERGTHLLRLSPHLSQARAVRPLEQYLAHYRAGIHTKQVSILVIHGSQIHTDSARLPNPPNRPSLSPPPLPASHWCTWSLLTKLHPPLFHPDKQLGCAGCSRLISKLLFITADCINTSSTSAAPHNTKVEGGKNKATPVKNRSIGRWTTRRSK